MHTTRRLDLAINGEGFLQVELATEFVMDLLSSVQLKANINALEVQNELLGSLLDIKT